jgi:hypothetical protein
MRKTFNMSDNVVAELVKHSKENKTTQGKVVEVAISLYLSMYKGANAIAQSIENMKIDQPAAAVKKNGSQT